ncbi:MAG: hypothetical protein RL539_518, partial [Pseudomonadota bacterium]
MPPGFVSGAQKKSPPVGGLFSRNRLTSRLERVVNTDCELTTLALSGSSLQFISTVECVQACALAQAINK